MYHKTLRELEIKRIGVLGGASPDGRSTDLTGRGAYELHATAMRKVVEECGGRFLFAGEVASRVIGEVGDMWDTCALVEYPSAAAFDRDRNVAGSS